MKTKWKEPGIQAHNCGKNNLASDPLHTLLVIVRSGAVYLYIVSLSGRNVTLPLYYVRQQTEFHQGFEVSLTIFKTIIFPAALQVQKPLIQFNPLKHMKLI
jgi:hypothetical protein